VAARDAGVSQERIFFPFLYCCSWWGYIVAFTKVLTMYQLYHTWIHHFHHSPSSPFPIHGIVTIVIIAFTYRCTHFLHHIHPSTLFPHHLFLPAGANPPPQEGPVSPSYSPLLQERKDKKKNMTFLFVWYKVSHTGSFPVVFPGLCLMVVSASLRFLYSFLYREYITHIQVLSFLLLPKRGFLH
jgi:hypothetical protein